MENNRLIEAKKEGRIEALQEVHKELLSLWEYSKTDKNRPKPDYLTACAVVGLVIEKEKDEKRSEDQE